MQAPVSTYRRPPVRKGLDGRCRLPPLPLPTPLPPPPPPPRPLPRLLSLLPLLPKEYSRPIPTSPSRCLCTHTLQRAHNAAVNTRSHHPLQIDSRQIAQHPSKRCCGTNVLRRRPGLLRRLFRGLRLLHKLLRGLFRRRLASAQSLAYWLWTCLWPFWSWALVSAWRPCAVRSILAMDTSKLASAQSIAIGCFGRVHDLTGHGQWCNESIASCTGCVFDLPVIDIADMCLPRSALGSRNVV